jgi:hypothetical protein
MLKSFFSKFAMALFFSYFKSISIEKISIFRLEICTIQIWTHLVKYYQYFIRVTDSNVWRNVPLFWIFASKIVTYVIQIDFKWKTCYIPPVNKDQINMNPVGLELITISSYVIFERLRIWIVRFQRLVLALFLPYLKSNSNEKHVIFVLGIKNITTQSHLVSYYLSSIRVTLSIDSKAVPFISSSNLDLCLLDFKSTSNGKLGIFMLGIRTISIGPHLVTK